MFLPDVSDVSDISLFALEHPSKNPPTHFPDSSALPFGMELIFMIMMIFISTKYRNGSPFDFGRFGLDWMETSKTLDIDG